MFNLTLMRFTDIQTEIAGVEAIDYFFAKEMKIIFLPTAANEIENSSSMQFFCLCLALSKSLRDGHVCLPIATIASQPYGMECQTLADGTMVVSHHGIKFNTEQKLDDLLQSLNLNQNNNQPLVYQHGLLYLRRYFLFENELQSNIINRLLAAEPYALTNIQSCLTQLFPESADGNNIDWQKVAVANAINKKFSVIAGGPGTGKTYTVTKLLAALVMLNASDEELNDKNKDPSSLLKLALVAPTGKAAQRLSESLTKAVNGFQGQINEDVLKAIPTQTQTIHRLLGVKPNDPNFRFNQNNLLNINVLIVDEVSMVDLPLMTRLFRALKADTKVILLGDADQLPSVAVGKVLSDLAPRPHQGYSSVNINYLSHVTSTNLASQLANEDNNSANPCDYLSYLYKSRRFDGNGGIGKLANAVIAGESKASWNLLTHQDESKQLALQTSALNDWLTDLVSRYYQPLFSCDNVQVAFELFAKFRVLCATRLGEHSVAAINQWVLEYFIVKGLINVNETSFQSMPIMIAENDYRLGLYNGDIGLLWKNEVGQLMAVFETSQAGEYKWLNITRLPKFDTVYAMTIHKTQGSEFDHVVMVLPKQTDNRLLSRELLYTGITRAKNKLTIASKQQVWQQGVTSSVQRHSGFTL